MGCMISVCWWSCTEMDHTYRDFWENGELVYPARPDSVTVLPGRNRIGLEWEISADPNVVSAKMYWNNKSDSLELSIEPGLTRIMLEDMKEGVYSFTLYIYDNKGNQSIPNHVTGRVYGDNYQQSLLVRLIKEAYYDEEENLMYVLWGDPADATSFASELAYKNTNGDIHVVQVDPDADTLVFDDYDVMSGIFNYRTAYLPAPTALDTFYTPFHEAKVKGPIRELDRTGWTVTA